MLDSPLRASMGPLKVCCLLFRSLFSGVVTTVRTLPRRDVRPAAARGALGAPSTVPPYNPSLFIGVVLSAPIPADGDARLPDRYNHRERGKFIPLHAQSIGLYETAQFQTDKNLLGALRKWRTERLGLAGSAAGPIDHSPVNGTRIACERIVVFSKRDLVPEWGIEVRASRAL